MFFAPAEDSQSALLIRGVFFFSGKHSMRGECVMLGQGQNMQWHIVALQCGGLKVGCFFFLIEYCVGEYIQRDEEYLP